MPGPTAQDGTIDKENGRNRASGGFGSGRHGQRVLADPSSRGNMDMRRRIWSVNRPMSVGAAEPKALNRAFPLAAVSVGYLALPVLLFFAGWLRPAFGIVFGLLTVVGLGLSVRKFTWRVELRTLATAAALALLMTSMSGAGGVGLQNWDYDKHNAVLHDLITHPWPVRYVTPGETTLSGPLVYYVAYYLPAAAVGKLAGWGAANAAMFVWTWLGVTLAFAWVTAVAGGRPAVAILGFVFWSGLDVLGAATNGQAFWTLPNLPFHHWAGFAQYSENVALIDWVPHHFLPALIVTGLWLRSREEGTGWVGWCLLPLWSPWAAIGLFPFLISTLRRVQVKAGLVTLAIGVLPAVGLFLLSNQGQVVREWGWAHMPVWQFPFAYLRFVAFEFGCVGWLVLRTLPRSDTLYRPAQLAVGLLLAIPLVKVGISNDLAMRGSLPALFVLAIATVRAWPHATGHLRTALAVVWCVGALSPAHELITSLVHYRLGAPTAEELRELPMTDGEKYARQFLGNASKPFWRLLAR